MVGRHRHILPKPKLTLKVGLAVFAKYNMCRRLTPRQHAECVNVTTSFAPANSLREIVIPKGSLLVYAGTVNVTEVVYSNRSKRNYEQKIDKHTVIASFGRCIIDDLSLITFDP